MRLNNEVKRQPGDILQCSFVCYDVTGVKVLEAQDVTSKQACSHVSYKKPHQSTCSLVLPPFSVYFYPPWLLCYILTFVYTRLPLHAQAKYSGCSIELHYMYIAVAQPHPGLSGYRSGQASSVPGKLGI